MIQDEQSDYLKTRDKVLKYHLRKQSEFFQINKTF